MAASLPLRKRRVLVVEDDDELRGLILANLQADGFDVTGAAGVLDLSVLFEETLRGRCSRPDLIVLDVHIPFFSGLELFRMLRRAEWRMPVVVISGSCDARVRKAAAELGARAVLQKPFALSALREALVAA